MTPPDEWAEWETDIVHLRHRESDVRIAAAINRGGFRRSAEDVAKKRRGLGYQKRAGGTSGSLAKQGWPPMRGEPEERDREYVRLLLTGMIDCGLLTITKTPTTPLPKGMAA